jgi:RNA polymerase sigma-70 factor (ECF subfamily)
MDLLPLNPASCRSAQDWQFRPEAPTIGSGRRPVAEAASLTRRETLDPVSLIEAIATRQDRQAFAELFGFYAPRVKAMLIRMGAPRETAEELAQETLLSVWRRAGSFDGTKAGVSTWIFTIARNLRIDVIRAERRVKARAVYDVIERDAPEWPDHLVASAERDERVRTVLKELGPDQIRVVELSFFEGRAHADIAETLKIPLGTVKSRLRLAMARLRQSLADLT